MSKGRNRRAKAKARQRQGLGRLEQPPRTSFLDIPPEIRIQIYGYTIRPETGPFSDFDGLYNSCRLIKHETDYECAKVLHKHLSELRRKTSASNDNELLLHMPRSFAALRNLRISLSTGTFHFLTRRQKFDVELLEHLDSIFALHLDTLIITYHNDDDGMEFGQRHIYWLNLEILNKAMSGESCSIKALRVVFELPHMCRACAEKWLLVVFYRHQHWANDGDLCNWDTPKRILGRGGHPVVVYSRIGSLGEYKEVREDVWLRGLQEKEGWGPICCIFIMTILCILLCAWVRWSGETRMESSGGVVPGTMSWAAIPTRIERIEQGDSFVFVTQIYIPDYAQV